MNEKLKCPRRRAGILCVWKMLLAIFFHSCNHVHKSLLTMHLGICVFVYFVTPNAVNFRLDLLNIEIGVKQ